jgi:choline dehydrogenase-like flavoprotein
MHFGRASTQEYNAFEKLGSGGWNWNELLKYFKKSEKLGATPELAEKFDLKFDPEMHGTTGPLDKTLPREVVDTHFPFIKALEKLGVPSNPESSGGNPIGVWTGLTAVHPETITRVSSNSVSRSKIPRIELTSVDNNRHIIFQTNRSEILP